MPRKSGFLLFLALLAPSEGPAQTLPAVQRYNNLPLAFETSAEGCAGFVARGQGYNLCVTSAGADLRHGGAGVGLRFVGSNPGARGSALDPLPGKSNYLTGADPQHWRVNVAQHARVRYRQVYPGIDVIYYGNTGRLEYDFVVRPGADPAVIRMEFGGASQLRLDQSGDLLVRTVSGELRQHRPLAYQEIDGEKRMVPASFRLHGARQASLEIAEYRKDRDLIVDPVLSYASYLGGQRGDWGQAIAVDAAGNTYIAGYTESRDFPVADALQPKFAGGGFLGYDAVVTKVNSAGSALVFSTYLGGAGDDDAYGIAVDPAGNIYVTGRTRSSDFPAVPGSYTSPGSTAAYVVKLNPSGSAMMYSVRLGNGEGRALALDSGGNVFVTGTAFDSFPVTAGVVQSAYRGSTQSFGGDVFVAKVNTSGSALLYSTYVGGVRDEVGNAIAADAAGNAYVTGVTSSTDFPTVNPLRSSNSGSCLNGCTDAFVLKLNPAGSQLIYSTYLGGNNHERGSTVAIDAAGSAYIGGWTGSRDYSTTTGAFQTTFATNPNCSGCNNSFVAKLNPGGTALVYSTYLGISSSGVLGIAVDSTGAAHFVSDGFPSDFYGKLNPAGSALLNSINISGDVAAMAMDAWNNLYITGNSSFLQTSSYAFEPDYAGSGDSFVVRVGAVATVSAAGLKRTSLAPLSMVTAFGEGLATATEAAAASPLPSTLAGTSIQVIDSAGVKRAAPMFYASAGQLNFVIPDGTALGPARIAFTASDGRVQTDEVQIEAVAPSIFSANSSGEGVAAALAVLAGTGGSQTPVTVFRFDTAQKKSVSVPMDLGGASDQLVLVLFGTGIRGRSSLSAVKVKIGDDDGEVLYAGPQGQYEGFDQVNVRLPRSLVGFGSADVVLTVDGKISNTVSIELAGIPRPRISFLSTWGAEAGQVVSNLSATGRFLSGVSALQFAPADGVTVTNLRTTETSVTAQVALASNASLGSRSLTVVSGGGVSAALPFTIRAPGVSPAPVISNVTVNAPLSNAGIVVVSGHFDFSDADGDIVSAGKLQQGSARIRFNVPSACTIEATGEYLHRPGQTSGSVDFTISYRGIRITIGAFSGTFTLVDGAGRSSNSVSLPLSLWIC